MYFCFRAHCTKSPVIHIASRTILAAFFIPINHRACINVIIFRIKCSAFHGMLSAKIILAFSRLFMDMFLAISFTFTNAFIRSCGESESRYFSILSMLQKSPYSLRSAHITNLSSKLFTSISSVILYIQFSESSADFCVKCFVFCKTPHHFPATRLFAFSTTPLPVIHSKPTSLETSLSLCNMLYLFLNFLMSQGISCQYFTIVSNATLYEFKSKSVGTCSGLRMVCQKRCIFLLDK